MGKFNSAKQFIGQIFGGKVSPTITKVKPNVGSPSKSALNKQIQKTKASGAKLKQTLFESKNKAFKGNDFTFATSTKKTPSNTELKDQADYLNKTGKYKVKKAKGGRVGLKRGTNPFKKETNVDKIKKTFAPKSGLKKIDPQKQKGLAKLKKARPDVVRKMGYFKRGGRS